MQCRFHDLRHYNASVMLALNIPDKYAMDRIGHSTPDMLKNVYQHTFDQKRDEVDSTVNGFFENLLTKGKDEERNNHQEKAEIGEKVCL